VVLSLLYELHWTFPGKNSCENIACDENSSQNANQMMGAEKVSSPSLQKDEDTTSNSKPGSSNVSGSIPSKEQPSQQNIGLLFKKHVSFLI